MEFEARDFNTRFLQKLAQGPQGEQDLAVSTGTFVREKLREWSFARKILPPEAITAADAQRSVAHDTLVKIVDIEPDSSAAVIGWTGEPDAQLVQGKRAELPFFQVASKTFQIEEERLFAYEMPVTKVIEDNSVRDVHEAEDRFFLGLVEKAIAASGKELLLNASNGFLNRNILSQALSLIDYGKGDKPLATGLLLLSKIDYDHLVGQGAEQFGIELASETMINGFRYSTILGHGLVVTSKVHICNPGSVYTFTLPHYLGKLFVLQDTKFFIKKDFNLLAWRVWEDIAMGIINGNACGVTRLQATQQQAEAQGVPAFIPNVTLNNPNF